MNTLLIKYMLLMMLIVLLMASSLLFTMSFVVWQIEGMFWYGLSTILFGVTFRALFDKWVL